MVRVLAEINFTTSHTKRTMTFLTERKGVVSAANSSTLALGAGGTYTGTYEDVSDYSMTTVLVIIDTAGGETATLEMDQSVDALGTDKRVKTAIIKGNQSSVHTLSVAARYFRIVLTAGGTGANGAVQVIHHTDKSKALTATLSETIGTESDAEIVRAIVAGARRNGTIQNVELDSDSHLEVAVHSPASAFGELLTSRMSPVYQISFVHALLNSQEVRTFTSTGGSFGLVNSNLYNGFVTLDIDATLGAYAVLRTRRHMHYRPGLGCIGRFTATFDNNAAALSTQRAGFANIGNEFSFGYNGSSFGILRQHDGVQEVRTLTVTAAAGGVETITITLDGIAFQLPPTGGAHGSVQETAFFIANVTGTVGTSTYKNYTDPDVISGAIYTDSSSPFAQWTVEQLDDTVIFTRRRITATGAGAYSLASTGTANGTFALTMGGQSAIESWTPQANWNIDPMDGTGPSAVTLDVSKGNVYAIQYQWLGYGAITYFIEGLEGRFTPVHREAYANTSTTPSVRIPHMFMQYTCASLGSTTALSMRAASAGGFIQGQTETKAPLYSESNTVINIGANTETAVLTLRSPATFNGVTNFVRVEPLILTVTNDSNREATINLIFDASTASTLNFQPVDASSAISYDKTSYTSILNGTRLLRIVLSKKDSRVFELDKLGIELDAGETLLISAVTPNATNTIGAAITWKEIQ